MDYEECSKWPHLNSDLHPPLRGWAYLIHYTFVDGMVVCELLL